MIFLVKMVVARDVLSNVATDASNGGKFWGKDKCVQNLK